jgi:hypothetical protein
MLLEAAKIVACILWLLLCLRCYTMISRKNVWQRRLIAMGAGLGAGLIYLVATMLISVVTVPKIDDLKEPAEGVQIKTR